MTDIKIIYNIINNIALHGCNMKDIYVDYNGGKWKLDYEKGELYSFDESIGGVSFLINYDNIEMLSRIICAVYRRLTYDTLVNNLYSIDSEIKKYMTISDDNDGIVTLLSYTYMTNIHCKHEMIFTMQKDDIGMNITRMKFFGTRKQLIDGDAIFEFSDDESYGNNFMVMLLYIWRYLPYGCSLKDVVDTIAHKVLPLEY